MELHFYGAPFVKIWFCNKISYNLQNWWTKTHFCHDKINFVQTKIILLWQNYFVMTKWILSWQNGFCNGQNNIYKITHDKIHSITKYILSLTKNILSIHKIHFVHNQIDFVMDKIGFVLTQNPFCHKQNLFCTWQNSY